MSAYRRSRPSDALRPVEMVTGFHRLAEGSVLYKAEGTVVLATASVDEQVPEFLKGRGEGWVTAEYQMHPRANPHRRERRDGRERPLSGRAREIERLIGRALRAGVDRRKLGERQIIVDCEVLEADGGTRTACVTAGFVALAIALDGLRQKNVLTGPALRDQVASISVGDVQGERLLDLCYAEDSRARFDLNVVGTAKGAVIELQGTAEAEALAREDVDRMVDLAFVGIEQLCALQAAVLEQAGVAIDRIVQS